MKKFNNIPIFFIIYQTFLHCACISENAALVKYLLSLDKLDINYKNILIDLFI